MKSAVQAGVILGVMIVVWSLIHGFTGWYKNPGMSWTFWMVIPFQVILLVWMLKNTKKLGFGYGKQVLAGAVMSLVAAVIVFLGSYLITPAVFPTYFTDLKAMTEGMLAARGVPADQIQLKMANSASMFTPIGSSTTGFIGTLCTGLVVSLLGAVLIRHKGAVMAQA